MRITSAQADAVFEAGASLSEDDIGAIAHLEAALREKDDIIQAQYAEIASLRERLALGVKLLNEMSNAGKEPTSSNLGHG